MSITTREAVATFVADPKADVVADDRTRRRHSEYRPRGQTMGLTRVRPGNDEGCLPWEGYPEPFQAADFRRAGRRGDPPYQRQDAGGLSARRNRRAAETRSAYRP